MESRIAFLFFSVFYISGEKSTVLNLYLLTILCRRTDIILEMQILEVWVSVNFPFNE